MMMQTMKKGMRWKMQGLSVYTCFNTFCASEYLWHGVEMQSLCMFVSWLDWNDDHMHHMFLFFGFRYEDFFGGKKTDKKKKSKTFGGLDDMETYPNGHNSNQVTYFLAMRLLEIAALLCVVLELDIDSFVQYYVPCLCIIDRCFSFSCSCNVTQKKQDLSTHEKR